MTTQANAPDIAELQNDNPNPAAPPPIDIAPAPEPAPEADDAAPVQVSIREQIAARFKAQRAAEEQGIDTQPDDGDPPPAPEAPPAPVEDGNPNLIEPERYKVKVRGNEFTMSKEDIIKTAGLKPEEAEGIPLPSLIRAAQINAAAQDYLTEARTAHKESRTAGLFSEATPAPANADAEPDEAPPPKRGTPDPDLIEVAQKIQFGDPEEAAAALDAILDKKLERRHTAEVEKTTRNLTQQAVLDFQASNPDLFADPIRTDVLYVASMHEIKKDLMALGASKEDVDEAVANPAQAVEAHALARMRGLNVRDPDKILNAAATTVRQAMRLDAPSPSPTPAPQSADARTEAKRALTQQPRQATVPPAQAAQAAQPRAPSSVVMAMRKARGQPV
jgi:hypothetical protein